MGITFYCKCRIDFIVKGENSEKWMLDLKLNVWDTSFASKVNESSLFVCIFHTRCSLQSLMMLLYRCDEWMNETPCKVQPGVNQEKVQWLTSTKQNCALG